MAKKCAICEKKSKVVWQRSRLRAGKYNPTTKKRQYPNLQWVKLASGPPKFYKGKFWRAGKRVLACAKCIKAMIKRR